LLNFSRPKSTGLGTADAVAVVTSVTEVFSVQAGKKGVDIQLHCPRRALPVQMNVNDLEQVISNLIINAIDAVAEQRGEIRVRITADGAMVTIIIDDNGTGIAADDAPHIFTPFFSTKEIGVGTGLGLTMVYGMVTDVGGWVEVGQSSDLGGAQFKVILPLANPAANVEKTP
jgi:C4-dicarboxylate-specific signal transduction histidine kinase